MGNTKLIICLAMLMMTVASRRIVIITDTSKTRHITLKTGEDFSVHLPGNPSTGYSWVINNSDVLKESYGIMDRGWRYEKTPSDPNATIPSVGGGGVFIFDFHAYKPVHLHYNLNKVLHFVYKRPGQKTTDEDLFKFLVTITHDGRF